MPPDLSRQQAELDSRRTLGMTITDEGRLCGSFVLIILEIQYIKEDYIVCTEYIVLITLELCTVAFRR
jgi:hypothetical protein